MSLTLKLADSTELALSATPQQTSVNADGQYRVGYSFSAIASSTVTAESVNALVSNSIKTSTWSIVTDGTVSGTYSNFTILANGVTLNGANLLFTLCKMTDIEVQQAAQATEIASLKTMLAYAQAGQIALQAYIAQNGGTL